MDCGEGHRRSPGPESPYFWLFFQLTKMRGCLTLCTQEPRFGWIPRLAAAFLSEQQGAAEEQQRPVPQSVCQGSQRGGGPLGLSALLAHLCPCWGLSRPASLNPRPWPGAPGGALPSLPLWFTGERTSRWRNRLLSAPTPVVGPSRSPPGHGCLGPPRSSCPARPVTALMTCSPGGPGVRACVCTRARVPPSAPLTHASDRAMPSFWRWSHGRSSPNLSSQSSGTPGRSCTGSGPAVCGGPRRGASWVCRAAHAGPPVPKGPLARRGPAWAEGHGRSPGVGPSHQPECHPHMRLPGRGNLTAHGCCHAGVAGIPLRGQKTWHKVFEDRQRRCFKPVRRVQS